MAAELVIASREKAQAELKKVGLLLNLSSISAHLMIPCSSLAHIRARHNNSPCSRLCLLQAFLLAFHVAPEIALFSKKCLGTSLEGQRW